MCIYETEQRTQLDLFLWSLFLVCAHIQQFQHPFFSPQNYRYIASFHLSPSFIVAGHSLTFLWMCNNVLFISRWNVSPVFIGHSAWLSYAKNPTMALWSLVPTFSLYSTTQASSTDVLGFMISLVCNLKFIKMRYWQHVCLTCLSMSLPS